MAQKATIYFYFIQRPWKYPVFMKLNIKSHFSYWPVKMYIIMAFYACDAAQSLKWRAAMKFIPKYD